MKLETATAFPYQHLKDDHIRLIKLLPQSTETSILCSVHYSNLEAAKDNYIALSYRWGDPNITKTIELEGHEFQVTENLFHALSAIVQYHDRTAYYWIDALCINQRNIPEPHGHYYSNAKAVYTWLGPEDHETEIAFHAIDNVPTGAIPPGQKEATAVGNLASRPYFDRAWVFQEFIRARSLRILRGSFSCDWSALDTCIKNIESRTDLNFDYTVGASNLLGGRGAHISPEPDIAALGLWTRFYGCMMIFSQAKCFDPRDRVFAALGHPWLENVPRDVLKVDYGLTREEVVIVTLEACERIRRLDRGVVADELNEEEKDFVESIWQQMTMTICQSQVDEQEREPKLFKIWEVEENGWDCSRLPASITTQSGRQVGCSGPVLTYLLGLEEIQTSTD